METNENDPRSDYTLERDDPAQQNNTGTKATLEDDRIGIWVGLNDTGEVVQYFTDPDQFGLRIESVVSIGYVEAIPLDYDEVYTIGS